VPGIRPEADTRSAPQPPRLALTRLASFSVGYLRRNPARLLLVFLGVLLPLWGFGELAAGVRADATFAFDQPVLEFAHSLARGGLDRVFVVLSALGYLYGVIPADIALVAGLAWRRRLREASFALLALGGAAGLNILAKRTFARERPQLWESIAPEITYSFPSAHAMGSMALACVLVLLAWPSRWRWWVAVPAALFVFGVGLSRVYLGVHYPSDILAGWAAALVWTIAVHGLVFRRVKPWTTRKD